MTTKPTRDSIVLDILSVCQASYKSESLRFGGYIHPHSEVIRVIYEKTGVKLKPKNVANKSVGKIADTVMGKIPQPR